MGHLSCMFMGVPSIVSAAIWTWPQNFLLFIRTDDGSFTVATNYRTLFLYYGPIRDDMVSLLHHIIIRRFLYYIMSSVLIIMWPQ